MSAQLTETTHVETAASSAPGRRRSTTVAH